MYADSLAGASGWCSARLKDLFMAAMPNSPGRLFREALKGHRPLIIPGVFNALAARMAERIGLQAVYQSGAALSAGLAGLPDVGLLTQTEFAEAGRYLAQAVSIPVISDADTGFGEALSVERTVRLFESAGLAGLHLEDQQFPKRCGHLSGKTLIPQEAMLQKIRAAVAARRDEDFVIIARTDARAVTGMEDALARAKAYAEAGADMVFPEALETKDEFAAFAKACPAPLMANMTEFGKSPLLTKEELGELGYAAVLFPLTAFRAAMKAAQTMLEALFDEGTQKLVLDTLQTRTELYDLLNYTDFDQRDLRYFNPASGGRQPPEDSVGKEAHSPS
jgi:methylisocitrate lyase